MTHNAKIDQEYVPPNEDKSRKRKKQKLQQRNLRQNANYVNSSKIVAVSSYDNTTIQKLIKKARDTKNLIDLTDSQKPIYVLFMDNGQVILTHSMT